MMAPADYKHEQSMFDNYIQKRFLALKRYLLFKDDTMQSYPLVILWGSKVTLNSESIILNFDFFGVMKMEG